MLCFAVCAVQADMDAFASSELYRAGSELLLPTWALGLAGGAFVVFLAGFLTTLIALIVYQPRLKKQPDSRLFGLSLLTTVTAAANLVQQQGAVVYEAIQNFVDDIVMKIRLIIVFGLIGLGMVVLGFWHPELFTAAYTGVHCYTQPFAEQYVLPIVNTLRILYSFVVAFLNAGVTVVFAWTRLPFRVVRACTSLSTLASLASAGASAVAEIIIAFALWLGTGLFSGGRIELVGPFQSLGFSVNASRPIADCLCDALGPVWDFILAIPQLNSLHVGLDCTVNIIPRLVQLILLAAVRFETPRFNDLAEEIQCTARSAGDFVEDGIFLGGELFYGIYTIIRDLFITQAAAVRNALTAASTATFSVIAQTRPHVAAALAHPSEASQVQFARQWQPFGDQLLDGLDLFISFGFDTLMRLLGTPYTRIVTEPFCTIVGGVNMTLETIFHPIEAFGSSRGIAYFQVGHLGDNLRTAADALSQLTIIVDARLPCSVSQILQTIVSIAESVVELFWGFIFHIAYSPWTVGEPPPINCSVVPCDGLPGSRPADWSFLDIFPDYYAWNGSRLRRSYYQLLAGGECTAYLFGCETAALNNPDGTNVTDLVCANAPAACLARSFNKVAVEAINTTLALVFLLPDIVRFNRDYLTARDLPFLELEAAFTSLVECVSNWLDTLDENDDMCLTTTVPEGPIEPGESVPVPPPPPPPIPLPPGQSQPPLRSTYDCRADGRAYFLDGRAVMVTLTSLLFPFTSQEQHLRCDVDESRRCAVAGSTGGLVQIIGSQPEDNATIYVGAIPGVPKLQLFWQRNAGNVLVAQPSVVNFTTYGISSLSNTSCVASTPPPDPLPETYACRNNSVHFIDVKNEANATTRIGPVVNPTTNATVPCTFSYGSGFICNTTTNTSYYKGRPVFGLFGTFPPYFNIPMACGTEDLGCVLNRVMFIQNTFVALPNETAPIEVFYTPTDTSTTRFPIPCERIPPPTFFCNDTRVSINGVNVVANFSDLAPEQDPVFCAPNPRLMPPACTRIIINYTVGASAVIEVEGSEVRATLNDTRVEIPCQYVTANLPVSTSVFTAAPSPNATTPANGTDAPMGPDRVGVAMKVVIARTNLRVTQELKRPGLTDPRYSRADLAFFFAKPQAVAQAANFQGVKLSAAFYRGANTSQVLYRKETLLCCFSAALRSAGIFVVATVFEIVVAARDLLALPAFPELGYAVPTFVDSRDALRSALCKLACAVTQILPILSCNSPGLVARTKCSTSNSCTRNLLCAVFDIPLLLVDYLIDVLTTLRDLAQGRTPGDDANILGVQCAPDDVAGCFVSVVSYIVLKALRVFTAVARNVFAFLDCLICGLIRIGNADAACSPILLTIFEPLLQAIDGIAGSVLTLALNLVVGVVEGLVFFFTGDFVKLFTVSFVKFFQNLALFGRSVFEIIINLLLAIPGISEIVNFILDIARDACTFIEGLVKLSVPSTNFNCGNIPSVRKRGTLTSLEGGPGWLPFDEVWAPVTGAAHGACHDRMVAFNASDLTDRTPEEQYEILYCQLASRWVGPNATVVSRFDGGSECDTLMPMLYASGLTYSALDPMTQRKTVECIQGRAATAVAHGDGATWLPSDLFYNIKRWTPLLFDAVLSHDVYAQYMAERSASADVLLSAQYRWGQYFYGGAATVAHLDALADQRMTIGAATVRASIQNRTFHDYAAARVSSIWHFTPGSRDPAQVARMAEQVWASLYEGNNTLGSRLLTGVADFFVAREHAESVSVAPDRDFFSKIGTADATGLRGLIDALMLDLPSILVRGTRLAAVVHEQHNTSFGSATAAAFTLPAALTQASLGAMLLVSRTLGGGADSAASWLQSPAVIAYLQTHSGTVNPVNSAAANISQPAPVEAVSTRIAAAFARLLPSSSPLHAANMAFQRALNDRSITPARARRLAISRFGARVSLAMAASVNKEVRSLLFEESPLATERFTTQTVQYRVNTTETLPPPLPCQFYIINVTDNTVSYPFCDDCLGLDQSLGYTWGAALTLIAFFSPNSTSRVSFTASTEGFYRVKAYLDDPSAPAILGDSAELPARWPWKEYDNWRILGDDRPNKKRFSSVEPLAMLTYNYFVDLFGASGGQGALDNLGGVVASSARRTPFTPAAGRSINSMFAGTLQSAWRASRLNASHLARPVNLTAYIDTDPRDLDHILLAANMTRNHESNRIFHITPRVTRPAGADFRMQDETTLFDLLFAWVEYFRTSAISCSFGSELNGANIQFSLGETFFIVLVASLIIAVLLSVAFPAYFLTIFGGIGMIFGLLVLVGNGWIAYEWSYGCIPAAPITAADDFVYFLTFNLFTRCSGGGLVDQPDYDNLNCASCENWLNGRWTIPNFMLSPADGGRFGFEDFTYNIVYALRWLWPEGLAAIQRNGPSLPVVGPILGSELVQTRFRRFAELDFAAMTPTAFSQYTLGFFITFVINLVIVIAALAIAGIALGTVVASLYNLLKSLIYLAVSTVPASILSILVVHDIAFSDSGPDVGDPRNDLGGVAGSESTDNSMEMTSPLVTAL